MGLPHHTAVNASPRYRPERDSRTTDPVRFLHDRRLEAERICALWERSRARDAAEQLRYWRDVLQGVDRQIKRLGSPHE